MEEKICIMFKIFFIFGYKRRLNKVKFLLFLKKINIFFFIYRIVLFKMVEVLILGDELSDEDL